MYPNIMTTNRLQPDSMIDEAVCAACDFNRPGKTCDRRLPWSWRGEFLPAKRDEYNMIRHALENEKFPGKGPNSLARAFQDLSLDEQTSLVRKRLTDFSKKIYHKIHDARTMEKEAIICQRENPFYVDTVKNFRDRRYDFKGKQKVWKGKTSELEKSGASSSDIEEAKKMIVLFDSLQLAHKVILNSFYGYVMRKGSRWYSMEMAGVTCLTGARIIQMARQLVERLGRPLELDTDGIWCILPATFPENFTFKLKNGKKMTISYPCVMLNHLVHGKFTNHQYQELVDPATFKYETHSDNTIFFEVDGPYKAMILPTSKEEDKNLKKRYAVFNDDGSLAELKGFEVKRRGELKLIKIFQQQIFKFFLEGSTLEETYAAVAKVANKWLDVLDYRGSTLADEELIDLICENKSMTKTLEEYGAQKSTAITTAKRLAAFLGDQMVKDKGLNCKYIISSRPRNAPVTERAIPVAIFSAEESVKKFFLRRWLKEDPGDMDPRTVIDWGYYMERLGSVIQKLITIPAALQKISNPVPRVAHPEWLDRRIRTKDDALKQQKMTDIFAKRPLAELDANKLNQRPAGDMEDFGATPMSKLKPATAAIIKKKWKIQKAARKRRRQLFGEKRADATDAIGTFFRNQAELLYTTSWQLLDLRETQTPGEVLAFILIDKKVVNHTLPNGHPSTHLFKLSMSEQTYVKEANLISMLFSHPSVEGVYEKDIPLNVRAMLELGCVCTFDESQRGVLGKGLEHGFNLSSLRAVPTQQPYLRDASLSYLALYQISAGERQIYALFSSTQPEAKIVILNRARSEQGMPNVDRLYSEMLAAKFQESNGQPWQVSITYQESLRIKTVQVTTQRRALQELGDAVKKIQKEETAPIMLVLQSHNAEMLVHDLPVLENFPMLRLRPNETDRQLPPLGGQAFVAKRLLSHYLDLGLWITHLLEFARYGNVPLCNLEMDDPRFLIDIAYARRLQKERVILWWSQDARPDHAGHERDDILSSMEVVNMPSVNNPGTCRAQEDALDETTQTIQSENAFAAAGISALRDMVRSWWQEACNGSGASSMADILVQHLVRWVESPSSHLYDRNLHYYVQIMSRKAFQQLMSEFRRVGSHVVFANAGRLLLQTSKAEVGNAFAYSQYILQTISTKPAFHFLDLAIAEYWDYLVWYDEFNYGGKGCTEVVEAENQTLTTIMHWQMATFLPPILQPEFNQWVVEYIDLMHRKKKPSAASLMNGELRATQIPPHASALSSEKDDQTTPGDILAQSLSKPLLKQIHHLIRRQRTEAQHAELLSDWTFPRVPGAHLNPQNPVLELVKSLMQVLSLDKTITLEARLLRKNLLNLFEIREFSADGAFINPSASLCIKQLSCAECCVPKDIDLCRDTELLAAAPPAVRTRPSPMATTTRLLPRDPFSRNATTARPSSTGSPSRSGSSPDITKLATQWMTQDLKCRKCARIRMNDFMDHCACAGEWTTTLDRASMVADVKRYTGVARFYGLRMLESVVEGILV
ncbi:hypothetical protein MRB53_041528 [Persea americana]|nr:hypothetical protein MRB53_041528 [Persea americana]